MITRTGKVRQPPRRGDVHQYEIEPGRSVPSNWDEELFESWAERKARRAAERAGRAQ